MRLLIKIFLVLHCISSYGQDNAIDCLDSEDKLRLFNKHLRNSTPEEITQESNFQPDRIYMNVNLLKDVSYDYLIKGIEIDIVNTTKNDLTFYDGILDLICQAKNDKGEWVDIELRIQPWDYNEVPLVTLRPNSHLVAISPCYQGSIETTLRYRWHVGKSTYYSNEFKGTINSGQLANR